MKLPGPRVTARSRRLAKELIALRERKGLTPQDVVRLLEFAKSTMYRIETGQQTPKGRNLRALLALYEATDQERDRVIQLAKADNGEGGWLHAYEVTTEEYAQYISLEEDVTALYSYEPLLISGLLQTEDYARAVIQGMLPWASSDEIERKVEVRTQRQRQAFLRGVNLKVVVDEAALWRVIGGPAVMQAQLRALRTPRPKIEVRVIPFGAGAHPGIVGPFVLMEFDDDVGDLVYVEFMAGEVFREQPAEVEQFHRTFGHLWGMALDETQSAALVETIEMRYAKEGSGRSGRARKP
jgi:transcriptional regulator with XRE-family HTH domain